MHSKHLTNRLVEMAGIQAQDTVLDIGAGTGALTNPLANKAKRVLAIEYDPVFVEQLRKTFKGQSHIKVINRDFLQIKLPRIPFCCCGQYSILHQKNRWLACVITPALRPWPPLD